MASGTWSVVKHAARIRFTIFLDSGGEYKGRVYQRLDGATQFNSYQEFDAAHILVQSTNVDEMLRKVVFSTHSFKNLTRLGKERVLNSLKNREIIMNPRGSENLSEPHVLLTASHNSYI